MCYHLFTSCYTCLQVVTSSCINTFGNDVAARSMTYHHVRTSRSEMTWPSATPPPPPPQKTDQKSYYILLVGTRLVFTSKRMLLVTRKDVLPAIQKSSVIYEYKCHCDSQYVGRTSQRLQDRIKQHVRQWLRQQLIRPRRSQPHRSWKRNETKPDCDSAIGQHLLNNDRCALNCDDRRFSILAAACSSFYLNLLEAAYIKTRRPVLCRQKEFVYTLKLFQ